MKVECPHCQTIFKVTESQLLIADGMVRCGLCQEVFNAIPDADKPVADKPATDKPATDEHAAVMPEQAATQEPAIEPALVTEQEQATAAQHTEPVTTAAPRLTTGPVQFADAAVEKQSAEATRPPHKTAAAVARKISDNHAKQPPQDDLFDGVYSKLIPDEYRIPELHRAYSIWRDTAWSLAILLLTVSLFAEYAWFNRNQLVTRTELKPWIEKLCATVDCARLELRDPQQIEMLSRNIYSHPNISSALMVSVTMINHASFAQPYPDVNIDFSNARGDVVVSRVFTPAEYLQLGKKHIKLIPAGVATDFHLEIQDPGASAMTYEFSFL